MNTGESWEPVTRHPYESTQMFGRRRKEQVRRQYAAGVGDRALAAIHGVTLAYVRDAVGIKSPKYEWTPTEDILKGPFPSYEEAMAEAPLISANPRRMSTDQAIARAIQFYRWHMS